MSACLRWGAADGDESEELGAPGGAQSIVTTAATDQSPISGETLDGLEHHRLVILQLLLTLSTTHSTAWPVMAHLSCLRPDIDMWYVLRLTTTSAPQLSELAEFTVKLSFCSIVPERIKYHEIQFFHQRSSHSYANVPLTGTGVNCNLLNRIVINLLFSPWEIIKIST